MSVIGRTWRRAPKFRVLVAFAVTMSALATLFPPNLPLRHGAAPAEDSQAPPADAHYRPPPPRTPLGYSEFDLPPPSDPHTQLVAFAGRQVPLPAGPWTKLAVQRNDDLLALQASVFGRIQDSRLSGLLIIAGTPPVEAVDLRTQPSTGCVNPTGIAMHQLPPVASDPALRECWSVQAPNAGALRQAAGSDPLFKHILDRLDRLGVSVPDRVVLANYVHTDDSGGLKMELYLPADRAATQRRTELWMQHWVALLRRGFAGSLQPQDVLPALARDPASAG